MKSLTAVEAREALRLAQGRVSGTSTEAARCIVSRWHCEPSEATFFTSISLTVYKVTNTNNDADKGSMRHEEERSRSVAAPQSTPPAPVTLMMLSDASLHLIKCFFSLPEVEYTLETFSL